MAKEHDENFNQAQLISPESANENFTNPNSDMHPRATISNCWHLCTDGMRNSLMFRDREDFIHGMNSVAICSHKEKVAVLAFCLMDNHVHFVVNGYEENCRHFVACFLKRHSEWIGRRHDEHGTLRRVGTLIKRVDTREHLRTVISYVHRNPMASGICASTNYEWSSASAFFSNKSEGKKLHRVNEITIRELRGILHTRITDLPARILINEENMILPCSYLKITFVEKLFGTPVNYMYSINTNNDVEVDMTLIKGRKMFDDRKLARIIPQICRSEFGSNSFELLTDDDKSRLVSILRRRYHAGTKQIARLTGINLEFLSQLLGNGLTYRNTLGREKTSGDKKIKEL